MFQFATSGRARRVHRFRPRLEALDRRDQPSVLAGDQWDVSSTFFLADRPANVPPEIVDFTAREIGIGLYLLTGRVVDESPGGLTVSFEGSVPSIDGMVVSTNAAGEFSLIVTVRTDGTDVGTITASTVDNHGAASNEPLVYISPTHG